MARKNIIDIFMVDPALFKKYPSRHTLPKIAVGNDGTKLRQVDRS
jgi:hypothetical protein